MKNYVLENGFLSLNIFQERGRLKRFYIINKRDGNTIEGQDGSELFILNIKSGLFSEQVKSSNLKISDVRENKDFMVLCFSPIKLKKGKVQIDLVYELSENDFFLRKQLIFRLDNKEVSTVLDYIDFAPVIIEDNAYRWCLPPQENSHIDGMALSLGQPVFLSSAFYGCEFPATHNTIENSAVSVKYYSGKRFSEISDQNGIYKSVKAVIGVADKASEERLRAAFFEYIETISKPLVLRTQYNSWYDHMLNITDENIEKSFLEIEKAMTAVGTPALDCFVVDDGWNDYKKDFWCFNNKFPNEFYCASELSKAMGSNFGMWLGPRGGYTAETIKFARKIEKGGNGYVNKRSIDIDVGSDKYIRKTADFMLDLEKRFDLTYWKLDGFIQKPCKNKKHDHIVGGKNNMYYYSEVWEKWINVFSRLESESKNGVYINLTCYAPPSAWFLQWVNSMWLQVSDDMGTLSKDENGKKIHASKKDKMLTYRDDRYYDFSKVRNFCFPYSNLYNHDPIYANEADITMSDDEFRDYLFAMAARGSSFWEMYYSFNIMNEAKWRINNSVLKFVRDNLSLLKNSVQFGGRPGMAQTYGYGCFSGNEGLVMLRNPSAASKDYILNFSHEIGADKSFSDVGAIDVLPYSKHGQYGRYSFGDNMKISLSPFETKVIHFGKKRKPIEAEYIKALSENSLEVSFNQTIICDDIVCRENPIKEIRLLEDRFSLLITFENSFEKNQTYNLLAVKDVFLNESAQQLSFEYHKDNINESAVITGKGEFSIQVTTGGEIHDVLYKQGDFISLYIEDDRFVFRVGNKSISSKAFAHETVQVTAVRERNGVIKLYTNKKLDAGCKTDEAFSCVVAGEVYLFDENRVKVYSKALAYDEV